MVACGRFDDEAGGGKEGKIKAAVPTQPDTDAVTQQQEVDVLLDKGHSPAPQQWHPHSSSSVKLVEKKAGMKCQDPSLCQVQG